MRPHFEPFSMITPGTETPEMSFVQLASNISNGLSTLMGLVHYSITVEASSDDKPLMGAQDRENLLLLGITSAKMLGEFADSMIDEHNQANDKAQLQASKKSERSVANA